MPNCNHAARLSANKRHSCGWPWSEAHAAAKVAALRSATSVGCARSPCRQRKRRAFCLCSPQLRSRRGHPSALMCPNHISVCLANCSPQFVTRQRSANACVVPGAPCTGPTSRGPCAIRRNASCPSIGANGPHIAVWYFPSRRSAPRRTSRPAATPSVELAIVGALCRRVRGATLGNLAVPAPLPPLAPLLLRCRLRVGRSFAAPSPRLRCVALMRPQWSASGLHATLVVVGGVDREAGIVYQACGFVPHSSQGFFVARDKDVCRTRLFA